MFDKIERGIRGLIFPLDFSCLLLPQYEYALRRVIDKVDPCDYLDLMIELGIPRDISERIASLDVNDLEAYQDAHLSCFGRLQFLQPVGLFVAALVRIHFSQSFNYDTSNSSLSSDGAVRAENLFSTRQCMDAVDYLRNCDLFNGHVPECSVDGVARRLDNDAAAHPFGSYLTSDLLKAPNIIESMLSEKVLKRAQGHLGCPPTLVALQAWWNFPGHENNFIKVGKELSNSYAPQSFHRDLNDFRMFWVYSYFTDVDSECGPHEVLRLSGDYSRFKNGRLFRKNIDPQMFFYQYGYQIDEKNMYLALGRRSKITFIGKAGTTFYSNGFNLHRIRYPLKKPRLMFAARFSINPSGSLVNQVTNGQNIFGRLHQTDLLKYVTRHLTEKI